MNRDFLDMLSALCDAGVEFLVVGAHAMAAHGHPRATGDLDIWIHATPANALRVWAALDAFGSPRFELSLEDLTAADVVFQIGVVPNRIDLLTSISGVEFADAWLRRIVVRLEGQDIPVLGRTDLLANKRATGRPKDLLDAQLIVEGAQDDT